jgi:hypothetical protein
MAHPDHETNDYGGDKDGSEDNADERAGPK